MNSLHEFNMSMIGIGMDWSLLTWQDITLTGKSDMSLSSIKLDADFFVTK